MNKNFLLSKKIIIFKMKLKFIKLFEAFMQKEIRQKYNISIPKDIEIIKDIFKKNGYKLYIVGGAVRDALLGKTPKDFDLATDALPDRVEEILQKEGLHTLPTGKAFGVINVIMDDEYEIATFREDTSIGRKPTVSFTNIEGDVKRRDLTINALFYDLETKEIVDLVGGIQDIKNGVVRTVGAPQDRFNEDRLRILRALRFAGRFGSDLDTLTDQALKDDSSLEGISGERIRDEFLKGIKTSKSVNHFLNMINKYNLFDWLFGGLKINKYFLTENSNNNDVIIVLSRLLKLNTILVLSKKLNELKYSVDEVKGITFLISLLDLSIDNAVILKRAQKNAGLTDEQIKEFAILENIDLIDPFIKFNLTVTGPEVMDKLGIKPGPQLGVEIQKIETENFKKLL
jgi:tRNA nucleotidyltransferase/poly(A) polymerase